MTEKEKSSRDRQESPRTETAQRERAAPRVPGRAGVWSLELRRRDLRWGLGGPWYQVNELEFHPVSDRETRMGFLKIPLGTCLAVQWLRLRTSTAGGLGSILGRGTKIPPAMLCSQKKNSLKKDTFEVKSAGLGVRLGLKEGGVSDGC